MIQTIKRSIAGIVCLLLGGGGLWFCATGDFESEIARLRDYDYLTEIRSLEQEGRLAEAEHLADWVLAGNNSVSRAEVQGLRDDIHKRRTSFRNRARRIIEGFIKGDGTSVEELGGAIVSDFFLWGDIRDLAKQGYYKIKGEETDPVVAGLAAVGVVTSVLSYVPDPAEGAEVSADASFSLLKTLRKSGHLSKKFCSVIADGCRQSVKAKSLTKGMKEIVVGMKGLFDGVGTARAVTIMKHVDDVDALKAVSKMAKRTAEPTAILVRMHGANGVKALDALADMEDGATMLEKAARKGPKGLNTLLTYSKYGARTAKAFRLGHPQKLMKAAGRAPVAIVSGILAVIGLWNLRIWRIARYCRFSRKVAKA
jgi:hypothetical protein